LERPYVSILAVSWFFFADGFGFFWTIHSLGSHILGNLTAGFQALRFAAPALQLPSLCKEKNDGGGVRLTLND
jgi:hypothetical protein